MDILKFPLKEYWCCFLNMMGSSYQVQKYISKKCQFGDNILDDMRDGMDFVDR